MTKETTCFSGNCYACMDLCTDSPFLVCVNVCRNKKKVKAHEEAVRTVKRGALSDFLVCRNVQSIKRPKS